MRFAPEYVASVLNENFEDAKALFLGPLLSIHHAHLVMLAECGILTAADARALRAALATISEEAVRAARYDGTFEDLFFYIDRLIVQAAGADVGGRLHTARSRNDIDMTMYRMRQREDVLAVLGATLEVRQTLLSIAGAHRKTIFPAHTHTQPAQPTTLAHYLLGAIEQIERDAVRLRAAFETTNRNPLGACAITGTGFPIDRARTSVLLGFDGPTGNTYGSIATVDYLLENLSAVAIAVAGLGRVVQDLLLWCTAEVGYLRLSDRFVQSSSIMPQKRNPVALEHARAIGSKALGQATAVLMAVHNTPFGDIVDTEDDLQPLVQAAFRDARRALVLVAAALSDARFDVARMRQRAEADFITVTELADTLVRDEGLPFGSSHAIAARLIARVREQGAAAADAADTGAAAAGARGAAAGGSGGAAAGPPSVALSAILREVSEEVVGRALAYSDARLQEILSPSHFVEIRQTWGGPAPAVTAAAIDVATAALAADRAWLASREAALAAAARQLRSEVDRL